MRNTNSRDFCVATRTILRELTLDLIPEYQPISRAAQTNMSAGCTTVHPQAIWPSSVRILHWRLLTC